MWHTHNFFHKKLWPLPWKSICILMPRDPQKLSATSLHQAHYSGIPKLTSFFHWKKKINFLLKSSEWCLLTRISHCTHSSSIFLIFSMYFNFFLNDDKGFPFYGVTLTYADSAVLNLAQLATWAEFKNVQNLHKSTYRHRKKTL